MPTLTEIKKEADQLSPEDKIILADYLWASIPQPSLDPEEEELNRRDEEMDTGKVEPISYQQFLKEVGRG